LYNDLDNNSIFQKKKEMIDIDKKKENCNNKENKYHPFKGIVPKNSNKYIFIVN